MPWRGKVPGIRRRLTLTGATLFMTERQGVRDGFALAAPHLGEAELFYLATCPNVWGTGLATHLLHEVDRWAASAGYAHMRLWVITDNHRAIQAYEHAGWVQTDHVQDSAAGRSERMLKRTVSAA